MKKILICLGIILGSLAIVVFIKRQELKDYPNLQSLGAQSVVATELLRHIRVEDGTKIHTGNYSVRVPVMVEGKEQTMAIPLQKAYDVDNNEDGKKAYKKKTEITAYFYYANNSGEIYYSKTAKTIEEYVRQEMEGVIKIALIIDGILIVPFFIAFLFEHVIQRQVIRRLAIEENAIVCSYSVYIFSMLFMICIGIGVGMYGLSVSFIQQQEYAAFVGFAWLGTAFFFVAGLYVAWMRNRILILHSRGITFKDVFGHVYEYRDEQVEYWTSIWMPRNRYIRIRAEKKDICINYYCTNFYEAEAWLAAKYPKL